MEWLFCVPVAFHSAVSREAQMKLLVSYLVYPALSLLLFYVIAPDFSYVSPRVEALFLRSLFIVTVAYLYVFFLLLPTVIRFIVKRKGVKYGLEAFLYTASSIAVSLFLSYMVVGKTLFPGILDFIAVHNILTYRTTGGNTTGINERNIVSLLSFLVLSGWGWVVFGNGFPFSSNGLALWGPLIGVRYILNSHKDEFQGVDEAVRAAQDREAPTSYAGAPVPRAQSAGAPMGKAVVYPWEEELSGGSHTETALGPVPAEGVPSASPDGRGGSSGNWGGI